ncbi:ThiJ/PfpI family protein, partial [Metarhizium brunneum ARSEF 3297]
MFKSDESSVNFLNNHKSVWEKTTPFKEFIGRSDEFSFTRGGGHGPMYDLVTDQDSIKLIEEFYNAGKLVAAVCHGPIVFRDAKGKSGEPLLKGKNVTGFTNVEEDQV